jgi:hypothetical protein
MDARCELCGVVTEISAQHGTEDAGRALATKLAEFECPACGTPHFVTRSGAHRLPRSVIKDARRRLSVAPRGGAESERALDGERLSDIRDLITRSSGTLEQLRISQLDLDQELAPEDVREVIRASLPPVSTTPSLPPHVMDVELAPAAAPPRRSPFVIAAMFSAVAIVTAGGSALARKTSPSPAASAAVAVSAITATHRATSAAHAALLEEQARAKAAADATAARAKQPQLVRLAPRSAGTSRSRSAAPVAAKPAAPSMTLAQAIAAAAGARPAAVKR